MKKYSSKVICIILALSIIIAMGIPVSAAVPGASDPASSPYLSNYCAYCYAAGSGVVQVWYDVSGTKVLDDIGSLSITLYESLDNQSFYWVKTFQHNLEPQMLGHSDIYYSSHVSYQGVVGRYYKAYVNIYGGIGNDGTNRYFWTTSVQAT